MNTTQLIRLLLFTAHLCVAVVLGIRLIQGDDDDGGGKKRPEPVEPEPVGESIKQNGAGTPNRIKAHLS